GRSRSAAEISWNGIAVIGMSSFDCGSKIELHTGDESSFAGQFIQGVQWIEPVVLIRYVQEAHGDFRPPFRETITDQRVELPKVVVPIAFAARKNTRRVLPDRE